MSPPAAPGRPEAASPIVGWILKAAFAVAAVLIFADRTRTIIGEVVGVAVLFLVLLHVLLSNTRHFRRRPRSRLRP